jgi:hypothetical protein
LTLVTGVLLLATLVGVLAADQILVRRWARRGLYRKADKAGAVDPDAVPSECRRRPSDQASE